MWTAHENRFATALKSCGQQKDADHNFSTLFHRLTTIAPERKEQKQDACGAKFNEFFWKENQKKKPQREEEGADMQISTVAGAPIGLVQRQLWVCVDLRATA